MATIVQRDVVTLLTTGGKNKTIVAFSILGSAAPCAIAEGKKAADVATCLMRNGFARILRTNHIQVFVRLRTHR